MSSYVVEAYVKLRKLSKDEEHQKKSHTYTSARTLLGILRLAQALARLRFSDTVEEPDIDEALRLMEVSKESLVDEEDREGAGFVDRTATSKIYVMIKDMASAARTGRSKPSRRIGKGPSGERDMDVDSDEEEDEELSLIDVRNRVLRRGFTETQFQETLNEVSRSLSPKPRSLTSGPVRGHGRPYARRKWNQDSPDRSCMIVYYVVYRLFPVIVVTLSCHISRLNISI